MRWRYLQSPLSFDSVPGLLSDIRTRVVNVKTEECDIYMGRAMPGRLASPYGNPFKVGRDGTLHEVLSKYALWLNERPLLVAGLGRYQGLRLGCWCAPRPCHVDYLVQLIEGTEPPRMPLQQNLFD